jgi:hypothetical protein
MDTEAVHATRRLLNPRTISNNFYLGHCEVGEGPCCARAYTCCFTHNSVILLLFPSLAFTASLVETAKYELSTHCPWPGLSFNLEPHLCDPTYVPVM